jgi:hypothetical protein
MVDRSWSEEDTWWRANFGSQPYAVGHEYEEFQPAYRYGFESARKHSGGTWHDTEESLRTGWDRFEGKRAGGAAWENIKDAVKDAWHRVTGQHDVDTDRMADFEKERMAGGVPSNPTRRR